MNSSSQNTLREDYSCSDYNSDFLAAIVHELKTPLNAILGFTDVLSDDVSGLEIVATSVKQDCLSEIKQAAAEMNELIHDILDVSHVVSGNFIVNLSKEIDVRHAIQRAMRLNYDYAIRRHVMLRMEFLDDLKSIKLDLKRTKQILTNLISNSIKYSPVNTEIKISAKNILVVGKEHLQITVADQGFGMNAEQLEHVFEKYQTFANPNSGQVDSFGLGLAIVKQLVELQNGKIEIKSELNKGTEVVLLFPYLL